jgi:hypothetical protein
MVTLIQRLYQDYWGIYEENSPGDPDAPFWLPTQYWDKVRFHSELQYLNDSISPAPISLTHQAVAGVIGSGYAPPATPGGAGGSGAISHGQILIQDQTLYTHNLGVVPRFSVRWNGVTLYPGMVIYQDKPNKHIRFASAYATTTIIGIRNVGISYKTTMPSLSTSYKVTLFRSPAKIPGAPLANIKNAGADEFNLGHGRITSAQVPLRQKATGDTDTFSYPVGQCVDIWGGAVRTITLEGNKDYGGAFGYTGGLVQAPFIELAK